MSNTEPYIESETSLAWLFIGTLGLFIFVMCFLGMCCDQKMRSSLDCFDQAVDNRNRINIETECNGHPACHEYLQSLFEADVRKCFE